MDSNVSSGIYVIYLRNICHIFTEYMSYIYVTYEYITEDMKIWFYEYVSANMLYVIYWCLLPRQRDLLLFHIALQTDLISAQRKYHSAYVAEILFLYKMLESDKTSSLVPVHE